MGEAQSRPSVREQLDALPEAELETMRRELHRFYGKELPKLFKKIRQYATELDKAYRDIQISKVAGSAGGIVGGVLSIVGFGLSFVTFGASSILMIVGAAIAGAGGATAGGASIADAVKSRKTKEKAEKEFQKCMLAQGEIIALSESIAKHLESRCSLGEFVEWIAFGWNSASGVVSAGTGIGVNMVYNTVSTGLHMARYADIAADATSSGLTLFRSLGNVGRGFSIAGGVVSAVFLPIDLWTLISTSIDIHKEKGHSVSKRLRRIVYEMERDCPSREQIDYMIDATLSRLRSNMN